jgi:hypothetical protein
MGKMIELTAGMGPAILNHLRQYSDLPAAGIVAGQAVASAVLDLYGPGGGIYNDIDVFHTLPGPREQACVRARNPTVDICTPALAYDPYSRAHIWTIQDAYRVRESWRKGMINFVSVSGDAITAHKIISGFDINCTRAAVDLATGQLAWTPEFEYFLNTRQLEICALQTPYHSSIRLVKKMAEMPWAYVDLDLNMELCCLLAARYPEAFQSPRRANRLFARRFGEKHAREYRQHHAILDTYFELVQEPQGLHSLRPRTAPDTHLLETVEALDYAVLALGPRMVYASRRRAPGTLAAKRKLVQDTCHSPEILAQAQTLGAEYLRGQVTERHVRDVETLINRHPALLHVLLGLTLDEQLQAKKRLARLAHAKGEWIYGVVETTATANDVRTDAALETLLAKTQASLTEQLVEVKFPAQTILGCQVHELVTQLTLKQEGETMRHCVGGYARSVQAGRSRILSLRRGHDRQYWSTAELVPRKKAWVIQQHRAYRNSEPHWRNKLALLWLVARAERGLLGAICQVALALLRERQTRGLQRLGWRQLKWKWRAWWQQGIPGRLKQACQAFRASWQESAPGRPAKPAVWPGAMAGQPINDEIDDIPF